MERIVITRGKRHRRRPGAPAALALLAVSCVSGGAALTPLAGSPALPMRESAVAPASAEAPQLRAALIKPGDLLAVPPSAGDPQAQALNAALPIATGPNPAGRAFLLRGGSPRDEARALECMTSAVYYEASSEGEAGQRAVAQVVLNRVRHAAYPHSVCGVVYQRPMRVDLAGCQFTFTCDGALLRRPDPAAWRRAQRIAADALAGRVYAPVGLSTHYHADYVLPAWAPALVKTAVIGRHIFYRLPAREGAPPAFAARYGGYEPLPMPVAAAGATPALASLPATPTLPPAAESALGSADALPQALPTSLGLPDSGVKPQFANSGKIRGSR